MGWKNIKEHYRIGHHVHVLKGVVNIGSPYIPDLITISPQGEVKPSSIGLAGNEKLERYFKELTADRAKLVELLNAPDTFTENITVYTYEGGEILEKLCEKPDWPNVTHDGEMMYENTFSTDKAKVVAWAKRNSDAGIKLFTRRIEELRADLATMEGLLAKERESRAKLEADHPTPEENGAA